MNWPQLENFHPESRVWIYTADRHLSEAETTELEAALSEFCTGWTAHNHQLKAAGRVFFNRYVVLVVDETQAGASGCSIDKSVHFLKTAGETLKTDFFDRSIVGIQPGDAALFVPFREVSALLREGRIDATTPVADTTLLKLSDFREGFIKPLSATWLNRYLNN